MKATGFIFPSGCFCWRTAPRPNDDASAVTTVSKFGSNNAKTNAGQVVLDSFKDTLLHSVPCPLLTLD